MKAKVLIVDDEKDLRELLAAVLEDHYDIAQADSGAAAAKTFLPGPARRGAAGREIAGRRRP